MQLWVRAAFVSAVMVTGIAVGCGGNVVVDATAGTGGNGGAGGEGGTTSNGTFTTSTSQTSTSITTSSSNSSSSSSSSQSSSVTTSVSSSISSSSSGPSECDNSGDCGDGEVGCLGCAVQGPCADVYNACISDSTCSDYANCAGECGSPSCQQKCAEEFPQGMQLYENLIVCAVCKACPNDCNGGPGCGGF